MDMLHARASSLGNGDVGHELKQLSTTNACNTYGVLGVDTVHELGNVLHKTLQVKDKSYSTGLASDNGCSSGPEDESVPEDCDVNLGGSMETCYRSLQKCATFPVMGAEEKTPDLQLGSNSCARSLSLPTARKLVSAMKGSREKQGVPPKKLSVSWAPDVYDPLPTSLSHYPKKKTQQQFKSNKKHGKGKQKGKNMRGRGSGPKDKKHYRKMGGKSDRCLDSYADTDRVMSSNHYKSSVVGQLDFEVDEGNDIGGRESNCGSSYLGKAGGTVHFAYAEAT